LHDPLAVALAGKQIKPGPLDKIVLFDQCRRELVEIIRARRNKTVHTTGLRNRAARISNQERRLITLDDRLGNAASPEKGLTNLETGDELLPILNLKQDCSLLICL
jgi:hypothetical protein